MSDYEHIKALRYKPTEEDINKIYLEMQEWRKNNPDIFKFIEADDKQDWGDYLEYVKYPDLINQESPFCPLFQIGFGETERYLDLVLYSDYGEESDDWYKVRATTPNEQEKYRIEFEKIFPGLDMSRVHLIDMCWYNATEPSDLWELTDDSFNKEDFAMNLFEQFVIWLVRNRQEVKVTTGLVYGHKIVKIGNFQFTELADNKISVDSPDFYTDLDNFDDLIKFVKGIR